MRKQPKTSFEKGGEYWAKHQLYNHWKDYEENLLKNLVSDFVVGKVTKALKAGVSTLGLAFKGNTQIKNVYKSIKDAPNYPKGFKGVQNGTKKVNVNNKDVLEQLREVESGQWKKIYKDGYDANGKKISIHYFQSPSGKVFDVKVKSGWSNK